MTSISISIYFVVFDSLMIHEQTDFVNDIGKIFYVKESGSMRKKKLTGRVLSLFLSFIFLISSISSSLLADNGTSSSETGNDPALSNPVEDLLDSDPSDLPIVGADSYLIYDASSDTKLTDHDGSSRIGRTGDGRHDHDHQGDV